MATLSPFQEVFPLFKASDGTPLTAATPTFVTYVDDLGNALTQPTISEVGGGFYKFIPTVTPGRAICYIIDGGVLANPRRYYKVIRPEDQFTDYLADIKSATFGRWKIFTSGPDANRLVMYGTDGVTVIAKYNLYDANGNPTTGAPFDRSVVVSP